MTFKVKPFLLICPKCQLHLLKTLGAPNSLCSLQIWKLWQTIWDKNNNWSWIKFWVQMQICAICDSLSSFKTWVPNYKLWKHEGMFDFLQVLNNLQHHWSDKSAWTMVKCMQEVMLMKTWLVIQSSRFISMFIFEVTIVVF